jgi:glutamate-1-semialdehyde aminotransferase
MAISRRGPDGLSVTTPMAPGVSPHVADSVLVLEYCRPESIEILERHGHELAAVVVDPQQTRRPGAFDTRDFLHDIRRVTTQSGTAMIIDEVVSGFRIHLGGAQAFYDVRADLAAYGKAVGAGLPVGVVAGKAEYLDGIDGGHWSYGDESYPRADQTFIQGSYFKHPFLMPAIFETLRHFQASGPRLQEELTEGMERLTGRLRQHFDREELPVELLHWGSICHFIFGPEVKYPSVFYYHLLDHGIYVRDARPWFLSTAHSERDIDEIVAAVKASTAEMRSGGFLPRVSAEAAGLRKVRHVAPSQAPVPVG